MIRSLLSRIGVSLVVALCPAFAFAQSSGVVKVSNAIEGGVGGVSAARCGGTLVAGFADAEPNRPNSYAGVAVSKSGGITFTDRGVLPVPPPNPSDGFFPGPFILGSNGANANFGESTPAVACANYNLFYYASVYETPLGICDVSGCTTSLCDSSRCTAISVSTSTDGGITWSRPAITTLQGDDQFHYLDPSIAVDPTNPMRVFVAYRDVDESASFFLDCGNRADVIEVVSSTDGGKTWTRLNKLEHACPFGGSGDPGITGTLGSPDITVSADGNVYVTDQFVGANGNPNEIHFLRSLDHGDTFSVPLKVSNQASSNPLPQLAVDRTTSGNRGTIYVTWSGSQTGTYTDTLVSESVDGGQSFSFPRPISSAPAPGTRRFQSSPVIASDNTGAVAACFYETPSNQPDSSSVYSYNCATSINHGATWQVERVADAVPVGYNSITSGFLLRNSGFF